MYASLFGEYDQHQSRLYAEIVQIFDNATATHLYSSVVVNDVEQFFFGLSWNDAWVAPDDPRLSSSKVRTKSQLLELVERVRFDPSVDLRTASINTRVMIVWLWPQSRR